MQNFFTYLRKDSLLMNSSKSDAAKVWQRWRYFDVWLKAWERRRHYGWVSRGSPGETGEYVTILRIPGSPSTPHPKPISTPPPTHILLQSSSHQCQWSEKKMTLLHNFSQCVKHTSGKGSIKKKLESLFLWQTGWGDIDKEMSENIDIDKISNWLEFGISNTASVVTGSTLVVTAD